MKIISFTFAFLIVCSLSDSLPLSERENIGTDERRGNILIPSNFGSVVGEIIVDSGSVKVQRANSERDEGPSFSPFISGPGISLNVGAGERDPDKKPPKEVNGATLVFNNEAAIAEIL